MQKCPVQSLVCSKRSVKWVECISPERGLRQPGGRRLRARPHRMKDLSVWSLLPSPPLCPQSLFRAEVHTWQWSRDQAHVHTARLRAA